jgi:hypothetical protein
MNTLLVGYDLNRPGQNYEALTAKLKSYSTWWHHLDSTWLIRTDLDAVQLRDELKPLVDPSDELLVIDISGRAAAWTGLEPRAGDWILKHL